MPIVRKCVNHINYSFKLQEALSRLLSLIYRSRRELKLGGLAAAIASAEFAGTNGKGRNFRKVTGYYLTRFIIAGNSDSDSEDSRPPHDLSSCRPIRKNSTFISADAVAGARETGATNHTVNIKPRAAGDGTRIGARPRRRMRFDVRSPPPASASPAASFMAAIGHLSRGRLFLRLIY